MLKLQHQVLGPDIYRPHFGDKEIIGAEIGVLGGVGSLSLLLELPNLIKLYSIDPWKHDDKSVHESSQPQEIINFSFEEARGRLTPFGDRSLILRMTSDEAAPLVPAGLDFVHIDGCHEYEQVYKDIVNYLPKIRLGGILSGHDYIFQGGVTKAVNELLSHYKLNQGDDDTWWIYI